ncbi:MAG: hypothetical protein M3Z27_10435 [Actinomycetota bacterium]|nr:hypothetical protein [Actinomycetota bacterium]
MEADLSYPIILGHDGRVMDGMHRIARALLEGRNEIDAVRFTSPLEPDYRDLPATRVAVLVDETRRRTAFV